MENLLRSIQGGIAFDLMVFTCALRPDAVALIRISNLMWLWTDLQREAEDLVGADNEELDAVFKFHLLHATEEASTFYESKQAQVEEQFELVAKQIEVCAQVSA
eukprot:1714688-Rhodomonas_salina.1